MLFLLGGYRKYQKIDWREVDRLVFVCKGNICRSAFAEAVAKSRGLNSISCGVETRDGLPANKGALEAAIRKGESLESHRTQKITSLSIGDGDLFVAMEPWQIRYLKESLSGKLNCTLLGLWTKPALPYIHDPYGNVPDYFDHCFSYIENSVSGITNEIRQSKESKH